MWSLPVALTTAIAEGTALHGDFRGSCLLYEGESTGVDLDGGHAGCGRSLRDKPRGLPSRDARGLRLMRPAAFCPVTGI
jgi:hypothetical protein